MKLSMLFTIAAVLGVLFGLAFLLMPEWALSHYDVSLGPDGLLTARFLGAEYLAVGLIAWFTRNSGESVARRAIMIGFFVGFLLGTILGVVGVVSGLVNALGWSTVVINGLLALGFGYFLFMKGEDES